MDGESESSKSPLTPILGFRIKVFKLRVRLIAFVPMKLQRAFTKYFRMEIEYVLKNARETKTIPICPEMTNEEAKTKVEAWIKYANPCIETDKREEQRKLCMRAKRNAEIAAIKFRTRTSYQAIVSYCTAMKNFYLKADERKYTGLRKTPS